MTEVCRKAVFMWVLLLEQQLFVAEEARDHIRVWSQRNEKKLFIIIFASIYKLSAYQATQAGYWALKKALGCNRTCNLQVIYETKVVTFFCSWNFSEQIRIWFRVGFLFNNFLKGFFSLFFFFYPPRKQFDASSAHSVVMISAWTHCDWGDRLHVWMNKKANASGSDVTPEFQIPFPLTPTIHETLKCTLRNLLLFWFVLELCRVIPDKTGPSVLN